MRCQNVHQQYTEGNTFWIRSEQSDKHSHDTASYTEDYLTPWQQRSSYIVCSHEECSEHYTTGKNVEYRVLTSNKCDNKYCCDEAQRSDRRDNLSPDQEQTSDDEITLHFDGSKAAIRTHKGSLTVTDEYGASSSVDIIYTITGIYPPELIKEFNDVRMTSNMKQVGFDLSEYFKDADNEILSYSATASVEGIVEFEIDSDNLIIRKLEEGITDVTVRASDSKGDYAEDTFTVNTGIDPGSGSVSVSPNPAVDYVEVRVSVPSDDADIKLVNPLGHVVYAAEGVEISMSSPCRIGLEGLAAGTYSVSVTSSGRTETARFVKL